MVFNRLEHQLHVEVGVQHGGVSSENLCMGEDKSKAVTERQYSQGYPRGFGSHFALKYAYLEDVCDNVCMRDSSKSLDGLLVKEIARTLEEVRQTCRPEVPLVAHR